jgi:hypothetical protein
MPIDRWWPRRNPDRRVYHHHKVFKRFADGWSTPSIGIRQVQSKINSKPEQRIIGVQVMGGNLITNIGAEHFALEGSAVYEKFFALLDENGRPFMIPIAPCFYPIPEILDKPSCRRIRLRSPVIQMAAEVDFVGVDVDAHLYPSPREAAIIEALRRGDSPSQITVDFQIESMIEFLLTASIFSPIVSGATLKKSKRAADALFH